MNCDLDECLGFARLEKTKRCLKTASKMDDSDLEFYIALIKHLCTREETFEKYKKPHSKFKEIQKMIRRSKSEFLAKMQNDTIQANDLRLYERLTTNIVSMAKFQRKETFKLIFEDLFEYFSSHLDNDLSHRSRKFIKKTRVLLIEFKERLTTDLQDKEFDFIRELVEELKAILDKDLYLILPNE